MKFGKCIICESERDILENNRYYPFCSERCQMIDLWGWFSEEYVISEPVPNVDENTEKPDPFWRN